MLFFSGVWTSEYCKENYAHNLQRLLLDDQIAFAETMISKDIKQNMQALFDQLKVFRREVKENTDINFTKPKITWTGVKTKKRSQYPALL